MRIAKSSSRRKSAGAFANFSRATSTRQAATSSAISAAKSSSLTPVAAVRITMPTPSGLAASQAFTKRSRSTLSVILRDTPM